MTQPSDGDHSETWYHGSPRELATLRTGSTVTQDRKLAEAFSHKPTLVSVSDSGRIKHNGSKPGFLYRIAEAVQAEDVSPLPRSVMEFGKEWLIQRELRVVLIGLTDIEAENRMTEAEVGALQRRLLTRDQEDADC